MLIDRSIITQVRGGILGEPKVVIIYGPRQSGKTTLLSQLKTTISKEFVFFNGDDLRTQELLGTQSLFDLKRAIGKNQMVFIDEAQRIENIGLSLKLIFDNFNIPIVATGSSSFDLANKVNEPLTGRTLTFSLYPLSFSEIKPEAPDISLSTKLEEFLRFGLYPKVITLNGETEKEDYLYELINTYLYKDILSFENVRKPKKVIDLLSLLALQIGSEVSVAELAQNLSISHIIVEKYLDLLEKMFVIINLRGFSRNLRKEISKTSKYFFVDLGLRNALIRNFNPIKLRADGGALFENFCIIERIKILSNARRFANFYFWRTYDQKEIDLIEEKDGKLICFEFKLGKKRSNFNEFKQEYKEAKEIIVTPQNFEELGSA